MDMKRTVIPRLHDTGMNFRAGMKISLRHKNRGELRLVWLAPAWHFVLVSCKRIQSHKREPEWTHAGMKVAPISCKHPVNKKALVQTFSRDWLTVQLYPKIDVTLCNRLKLVTNLTSRAVTAIPNHAEFAMRHDLDLEIEVKSTSKPIKINFNFVWKDRSLITSI